MYKLCYERENITFNKNIRYKSLNHKIKQIYNFQNWVNYKIMINIIVNI